MLAAQRLSEMDERWEDCSYEPALPVTEKSNPRTRDIDRAQPAQLVQLLRDCDAEIFQNKWEGDPTYQGMFGDSVVQTLVHVAWKVEDILKDPEDNLIVLSGCGTSGRLAYLLTKSFNRRLKEFQQPQVFTYIIAGGDKALLTSLEAPEDSPHQGTLSLEKGGAVCAGKRHVLFIGISCGLSAPFVAGQLDFCLNNLHIFTPVLIGFNPVHMSRTEPILDWPLTFRDVAERMAAMQKAHQAFIINPAVGPEPISGSSRMKGGSATKVLLETLLLSGHTAALSHTHTTHSDVVRLLTNYERVHRITYSQSEGIAFLLKQAGESLQKGSHVYYLGWRSLGILGLIDASECIPTFGAEFDDICGFINEGYAEMNNIEGDMSALGPEYCIGHADFLSAVLPHVTQSDTIIFLFTLDDDLDAAADLARRVKQKTSNLHAVTHSFCSCNPPDRIIDVFASVMKFTWPRASEEESAFLMLLQAELCTKWIVNAVSTGAHILKGKVYRNYMMDLKVTNSKLFRRAISLLQMFTSCPAECCRRALVQAIYSTDQISEELNSASITQHTNAANSRSRVVPTALVVLKGACSLQEAEARLAEHAVIRDAVEACLTTPTCPGTTTPTTERPL